MIDHQDNQTKPMPLDEKPAKRGRGRPGTGQALSNAERQRRYRENQKAQRNEKSKGHAVPYDEVVEIAQELGKRCERAELELKATREALDDVCSMVEAKHAEIKDLKNRLELAEARADAMGNELAINKAKLGRAMERKVKRHRDQPAAKLEELEVED